MNCLDGVCTGRNRHTEPRVILACRRSRNNNSRENITREVYTHILRSNAMNW